MRNKFICKGIMKRMQNEAWLNEEKRIVSFHEIPGSRYYSAEYQAFGNIIINLVLAGYQVQ